MFKELNSKAELYSAVTGKSTKYLSGYFKVFLLFFIIFRGLGLISSIAGNEFADFSVLSALQIVIVFALVLAYITVITCDKMTLVFNIVANVLLAINEIISAVCTIIAFKSISATVGESLDTTIVSLALPFVSGFTALTATISICVSAIFIAWTVCNIVCLIIHRVIFTKSKKELGE